MANHAKKTFRPVLSVLIGIFVLLTAIPGQFLPSWLPKFMREDLHLGLDLQGGTQLDFRISESEMDKQIEQLDADIRSLKDTHGSEEEISEKQSQIENVRYLKSNATEAIRTVLERRINSLGVSEAVITPSFYGEEKHLLVECPGVVDIQKCIATVGKTILLEFKEQAEGEDAEHIAAMRNLAENTKERVFTNEESLATVGQDLGATLGVYYNEAPFFHEDIPDAISEVWKRTPESTILYKEVTLDPIERDGVTFPHNGLMFVEVTGEKTEGDRVLADPVLAMKHLANSDKKFTLVEKNNETLSNLDPSYKDSLKNMKAGLLLKGSRPSGNPSILYVKEFSQDREQMSASHILIAYKGAVRANSSVSRSREEALALASDLRARLDKGESFNTLAKKHSDGPSAKEKGALGSFGRGEMSPGFEEAAFALKKGEISKAIETEFGFHIIRSDAAPSVVPGTISYSELFISGDDAMSVQESTLKAIEEKTVSKTEEQIPLRTLFFSFLPTGWKDTPLDGKHFRRATVTTDPLTGIPVVQIVFDNEGGKIFQELTKRNVGKPIAIFVGGELISAPNVQGEISGGTAIITGSQSFDEANRLAQDLNTGAIPAPIHLVGQVTVEPTLGSVALKQSLVAALVGFLVVGLYMVWYYRLLGIIAFISLIAYAILFSAILKLPLFLISGQYIVLSLAGIAGIILSVGMAVDANVLIFERMKEELSKGKLLSTAADIGFKRAWSSIRDSNVSTLLTALILFIIGTSIVRGFAITLSIGILLSMCTAIFCSRWLISLLYKSPIAGNMAAFGVAPNNRGKSA